MKKGRLFLIPVPLGTTPPEQSLPRSVLERARTLNHFVAENARSARAFLKSISPEKPLREIQIDELNEHSPKNGMRELLAPLLAGNDLGLISEAGCPAVADPGANLIAQAREAGIQAIPMVGPSAILLALMASGLSGQNFAFHGYLPIKDEARKKKILELEKESRREKRTQLFIETPYRNQRMFDALLSACAPQTRIGVAIDLTLPSERIAVHSRAQWQKREKPPMDKHPAVFMLYA